MATTTNYGWTLPTVGGSDNTWGSDLNGNWSALDTLLGGTNATEFAILDGAVITTTELNYLDNATGNIQAQIDSLVTAGGANNNEITISTGQGITGGASFTLNQASDQTIVLTGVTQAPSAWTTGTSATEGVVSPAKIKSAIDEFTIGSGQTLQSVSRSLGTSYQNTTGSPIFVVISIIANADKIPIEVSSNGSTWVHSGYQGASGRGNWTAYAIVPNNHYYRAVNGGGTINAWSELS